jgi:GTP-binding protein HflX
VDPGVLVGTDLGRALTEAAADTRRPCAILLDRAGHVTHVVVGHEHRVYLPELGRARAGLTRLRGLRLAAAFPGNPVGSIPKDILTDLQKLQLDAVLCIGVDPAGLPGGASWAHLLPTSDPSGQRVRTTSLPSFHALEVDFQGLVRSLEEEFNRQAQATRESLGGAASRDLAVLVGVYTGSRAEAESSMAELQELAQSAGLSVVDRVMQMRREADSRTILGKGKLEEAVLGALSHGANMIVFDRDLTPSQLNNITSQTELKVLDRTMLILDIFAQRARTTDGKLQVELAQLKYSLPRLAQRQEGLSRLTGGIGGRGPGETRLEIDRRRARDRLHRLEKQLDKVGQQRTLRRRQRTKGGLPVISIVGYTNAGKSTLLNALTKSGVYVADQLFATLDPVSRRLRFPTEREVIITDTVGFIRDLPPDLVNAFRATLEELGDADLLLHVYDGADPSHPQHIRAVEEILQELEITQTPRLRVMNKADLLHPGDVQTCADTQDAVAVSAVTGAGLSELLNRCAALLWSGHVVEEQAWAPADSAMPGNDELSVPQDDSAPPTHDELRRTLATLPPAPGGRRTPSGGPGPGR